MKADVSPLELRVLGGRHAGASVAAVDGLLIGADESADVILTDFDTSLGIQRLHIKDGRQWLLWPDEKPLNEEAWAEAASFGRAHQVGGLELCVSASHVAWQSAPLSPPVADLIELPPQQEEAGMPEADSDRDKVSEAPKLAAASDTRWSLRRILAAAVVLLGVMLLAPWFWQQPPALVADNGAAKAPDLSGKGEQRIADLMLALAELDPALHMQFTAQRDGRVLVSGWADSIQQLDRIADALNMHRPAPLLRVRVVDELRAELRTQLGAFSSSLNFHPEGPGKLRVTGFVANESERKTTLAAVRAQTPSDLELIDSLSLADMQLLTRITDALADYGFPGATAHWKSGREGAQLVMVTVPISANQRRRFEDSLADLAKRFPDIPWQIAPQMIGRFTKGETSLPPFPLLAVVGGDAPYVVLPDGARLLPGGTHQGWRLQAIESEVLVFDLPQRLVVAR